MRPQYFMYSIENLDIIPESIHDVPQVKVVKQQIIVSKTVINM